MPVRWETTVTAASHIVTAQKCTHAVEVQDPRLANSGQAR
jgi:hypothetical protein